MKTPRQSSCTFYPNAALAEAAGFRPCLRCRPELAPYALQQNLAYAIWQKISAGGLNFGASMSDLAKQVGLSTRQLQRLMQSHFGVAPIELAQTARLLFAKKLLQETALPMTEIAYASGFGSVRRFNALFLARYGLAPSALRKTSLPATSEVTLRLAYRTPFAWETMLNYLAKRSIGGVEAVITDHHHRCYVRSVQLVHAGQRLTGWLKATNLEKAQQVEIEVPSELSPVLMELTNRVRQQFDLDANPAIILQHLHSDPLLAKQIQRTPGLRVPGAFSHLELAIRAVLGQQVSVAGATTVATRLVQRFGTPTVTPFAAITHHFPDPNSLAKISVEDMAQIGLPKARAATIIALAQFACHGGLDAAPGATLEDTVARLKTVRGIGEWTAQYIALRALRFPDAFPAGDLGLQKAAAQDMAYATGRLTESQLQDRVKNLSPWRGYAALHLWESLT